MVQQNVSILHPPKFDLIHKGAKMPKKNASKVARKKAGKSATKRKVTSTAAAATVFWCFTEPSESWVSTINRVGGGAHGNDGGFRINREQANGDFDGTHNLVTRVGGNCSGSGIAMTRPADATHYYLYKGVFHGSRRLEGFRFYLPLVMPDDFAMAFTPPPGEPWEADKET
jgi:hypothetical protein